MLNIIKRDILTLLRDKGNLFFVVLFPSLLVFLLGNLLQHLDYADTAIEPIEMYYTVETTDPFGLSAIDALTEALADNAAIRLVQTDDLSQAMQLVDDGKAAAAVRFTQPLGVDIYEGYDKIQNRAIDSVFTGFARQVASLQVLAQHAPQQLAAAANSTAQTLVQQKAFGYNRTMLDYYAVAMIVMILFMGGAIGGASSLHESRKDGTLARMIASPRNRANLYIQSVLGAVPQNLIQVACVMLSSVLLFGAHYADTLADNLLLFTTLVLVGLCIGAFSMIIGMFIKVNPTLVIMPFLWVLMFFSGTFSKEIYVEGLTNYSPIWLVQNAAFDLTVFGRGEKCLQVALVSIAFLIVFTLIGALLFRRKGLVIK